MLDQAQLSTARNYFEQAQTVTIICGPDASIDVLAAVSTLLQVMQAEGKEVQLLAPRKLSQSVISGLDQVATEIGNQNLLLSFDYDESKIDKVVSHIGEETGRFYLTIKPKKGVTPLDYKQIDFSYTGAESDLLLLVGVNSLESLEQLYFGYEDLFEKTPKISFSKNGSQLGNLNINSVGYSTISECLLVLLNSMGISFSTESATNLLSAIDVETEYMRSLSATAITFEAVAQLMRMGARRIRPAQPVKVSKSDPVTHQQKHQHKEVEISVEKQKQGIPLKKKKKSGLRKKNQNPGGLHYDPSKNISRN